MASGGKERRSKLYPDSWPWDQAGVGANPKVRTWRRGRCGEDVGACWVCGASRTSGEMVRDGRALGSELIGGVGRLE